MWEQLIPAIIGGVVGAVGTAAGSALLRKYFPAGAKPPAPRKAWTDIDKKIDEEMRKREAGEKP